MDSFPASPKGLRPRYFDDPATDQLLGLVLSLASELSVTRDRLDALERLLASRGQLDRAALNAFHPDEAAAEERRESREAFMARLMVSIEAALDSASRTDNPTSEDEVYQNLD